MATEASAVPEFHRFSSLPHELRVQIWRWAPRIRVLQLRYNCNPSKLRWEIRRDSVVPDSVDMVCKEARNSATRFLGVLFHPNTDVLLLGDMMFKYRPMQKSFFDIENLDRVRHFACTQSIWLGLRDSSHAFPVEQISPATILRKLKGLVQFTFTVTLEEFDEGFDPDYYNFVDQWGNEDEEYRGWATEAFRNSPDREEEEDDDPGRPYFAPAIAILGEAQPLERDERGRLTKAAKVEAHIRRIAEMNLIPMLRRRESREWKTATLSLHPIENGSAFFGPLYLFEKDVKIVFGGEKVTAPDWKFPRAQIRQLESGRPPVDDQLFSWDYIRFG
ncbi:uncharacterized protein PAC_05546 [Phialocephala subalpina]|uniref:2EXR domain-containing protein n=1 Tax=Phialocephala subalpina TaxID=576137 RepID=A0A1L7WSB2_9HELO|nr:uncharacterized protein PAC_05546 [Phialocephala subalpina]